MTSINDSNIGQIHYDVGMYYLEKDKGVALDFFLLAHQNNVNCEHEICDLMIELKYYLYQEIVDAIKYLSEYIKNSKLYNKNFDVKYSIYCVLIDILRNVKSIDKVDLDHYLKIDERLVEYDFKELVDSIKENDISRFMSYIAKLDSLDRHLTSIFLCIKNKLNDNN